MACVPSVGSEAVLSKLNDSRESAMDMGEDDGDASPAVSLERFRASFLIFGMIFQRKRI